MLKELKNLRRYYIHSDGYIFKRYGGKEIVIPIKVKKGVPLVYLDNKHQNFVWMMLEYFGEKQYTFNEFTNTRFKFKIIDGKLPLNQIKRVDYKFKEVQDHRIELFKCLEKANGSNSRVNQISTISYVDVYNALLRTNFKCTYCNETLNSNTWELDHVQPISKGGLNICTNITPSCKDCNRMKGSLEMPIFLHKIFLIASNYKETFMVNNEHINNFIQES
jgi:5-methylcytosine-specific restriction endonuclease McrA